MNPARVLLLTLLVVGLIGVLVGGGTIYTRMFYVGVMLAAVAWLWARVSLVGIKVKRQARSLRASVGDIFEEHFEVINNGFFLHPWIEVLNETPIPGASGSRLLTMIRRKQTRGYVARTWLSRRGSFLLGPTALKSGDPFGLFNARKKFTASEALVVLPIIFELPSFLSPPGLLPGGKAIRRKALDITPHASGIREYVPGDPMKRIHWLNSARRGQLMVKEFEQDPQSEVWLFLDMNRMSHAQRSFQQENWEPDALFFIKRPKFKLPPSTLEYSVSAVASLAHYFIGQRRAVGLVVAERGYTVIPAERSERQEMKILETLAFLEAQGRLSISNLVAAEAGQLPQGSSAILVTPSASPDLIVAVDDLQRRHLRPVVVLLDAASFGGSGGTDSLHRSLMERSIPVCLLKCDEDIVQSLSAISANPTVLGVTSWRMPPLPH